MPGRTLATWYGRSKLHSTEEATSEGSGGERTEGNYPSEPPFYPRTTTESGEQYAPPQQYDSNYNYYQNLNQTPVNSGPAYPDQQHRNYQSTSYPQQYSPQSPASPVGSYSYPTSQPHHEMSYPNPQGAYNPNPSPGLYGSPNHAQGSNYPSGWTPQQSAADYTHHSTPSPQQVPSASPSPAHTPTPATISSPPPGYPAHHHLPGRHAPMGGAAPAQSIGHPAWSHPAQQAMSVHPGAVPLPPQAASYYPPPLASRGNPQHAHMSSDRHSPHRAWGGAGKIPHAPQNNGNPLFSLQMLVNQSDMNRAQQANAYRAAATSLLPETVDLSSTSTSDSSQSAPIPLTKPSDVSSLRNGSVPAVKSPVTPVNGDASSDSGISSSTPTPSGAELSKSPEKKPSDSKDASSSDKSPVKVARDVISVSKSEVSVVDHLSVPQSALSQSPVRSPKSAVKRSKKVDSILENLVESGSIKLPAEPGIPTPVIMPVIAAREVKKEEEVGGKSPEREEISPTNIDDDSGKPRRKRKLDKPLRVSKLDEVGVVKTAKEDVVEEVKVETKEEVTASDKEKSVESVDSASTKPETSRRRTSSEGSEPNSSSDKRMRRKSESDQKNSFTEVESQLEMMFAGIEGMETADTSATLPRTTPVKKVKNEKRGRPKGSKNEPKSSDGVDFTPESSSKKCKKRKKSVDSPTKKKGKGKLFAEDDRKRCDDSGSNASTGKIRGPLIRVLGPRESPYTVNVYNAPSQAEEGEKPPRTPAHSRKNHSDLDYRGPPYAAGKVGGGPGMFTSTLSSRYDSHTRDPTWLCAFCKRGPHSNTSTPGVSPNGDLFGPYVVARERTDAQGAYTCLDAGADDKEISAEQKKGGRNKKSLRKAELVEQFKHKMSKKAKRAVSMDSAPVPGLVALPAGANADPCYEVWVHEDCALWAAGTRIVGSRIYGLQDAVWSAVPSVCNKCGQGGANVGCVARNCAWRLHFNCAQLLDWDLDESTYIARCSRHRLAGTSKALKAQR